MGVNLKRKRGSLTSHDPPVMEVVMVMVALVLLINTNSCGASFVLKSNVSSYRQCISSGAMDGCLIADELDLDFDFFMDTHVVRILAGGHGKKGTGGTGNPNRRACYKKDGRKYECDPNREGLKKCDNPSRYNRANKINCYE